MSYLEQLKSENPYPDALPKLPKPPFDSFGSRGGRHFSEKKAPAAVVDLATPTGPRTVTVTGNATPTGNRITDAAIFRGEPTAEAVDLADRILNRLADLDRPATEAEALAAAGCDETMARNILHRICIEGLAEYQGRGLYALPTWPPAAPDLPRGCPLLGPGPHPAGCRFDHRLLRRMMTEGILPLPGGRCPLLAVCRLGREK